MIKICLIFHFDEDTSWNVHKHYDKVDSLVDLSVYIWVSDLVEAGHNDNKIVNPNESRAGYKYIQIIFHAHLNQWYDQHRQDDTQNQKWFKREEFNDPFWCSVCFEDVDG